MSLIRDITHRNRFPPIDPFLHPIDLVSTFDLRRLLQQGKEPAAATLPSSSSLFSPSSPTFLHNKLAQALASVWTYSLKYTSWTRCLAPPASIMALECSTRRKLSFHANLVRAITASFDTVASLSSSSCTSSSMILDSIFQMVLDRHPRAVMLGIRSSSKSLPSSPSFAWAITELAANYLACYDLFAQSNVIRLLVGHLTFETIEEHSRYSIITLSKLQPCHPDSPTPPPLIRLPALLQILPSTTIDPPAHPLPNPLFL